MPLWAWLLTSTLTSAVGEAPKDSETLAWSAPEPCPELAGVRALTEAYLGGPLEAEREVDVAVKVQIYAHAGAFEMKLELRAGAGVTGETHQDPSCQELAKLTAIKLALLIDPDGFIERYDEVEALAAETLAKRDEVAPEPTVDETPAPEEGTPTPPKPGPELRLGLGAGAGWGQLPGTTAHMALRIAAVGERWRFEARGLYGALGRVRIDSADAGLDMMSFGGAVLGCALPKGQRALFPVCAGVEAAALRATGVGTEPDSGATRPYAAATFGAGVSFEWRRVAVFVQPEASVALSRARFGFTEGAELYLVPPVSMRVLAGAELRFGR